MCLPYFLLHRCRGQNWESLTVVSTSFLFFSVCTHVCAHAHVCRVTRATSSAHPCLSSCLRKGFLSFLVLCTGYLNFWGNSPISTFHLVETLRLRTHCAQLTWILVTHTQTLRLVQQVLDSLDQLPQGLTIIKSLKAALYRSDTVNPHLDTGWSWQT